MEYKFHLEMRQRSREREGEGERDREETKKREEESRSACVPFRCPKRQQHHPRLVSSTPLARTLVSRSSESCSSAGSDDDCDYCGLATAAAAGSRPAARRLVEPAFPPIFILVSMSFLLSSLAFSCSSSYLLLLHLMQARHDSSSIASRDQRERERDFSK